VPIQFLEVAAVRSILEDQQFRIANAPGIISAQVCLTSSSLPTIMSAGTVISLRHCVRSQSLTVLVHVNSFGPAPAC
jgi:hypothetical protein